MINTKKLRLAIKAGDIKQVTEILHEDPKGKLRGGFSPLHVAVKGGHTEVVEAILDAGADINATTKMHQTALDLALQYGHSTIANLLRKRGGDPAARLSLHSAVTAGDIKAVRRHIRAGANVNELVDGELPLCLALQHRHWDVARYLLKKQCDVTKPQKWNATPLHVAASTGAPIEIMSKLVKLGAEIDAMDNCEYTPLCHAAEAGNTQIVEWLLDHGSDIVHGHASATAPVYCALHKDRTELASFLIDRGARCTLHQAIGCNHLPRARQLLNAGADVHQENDPPYYNTPLALAIWHDSPEMATLLIEYGADPNRPDRSHRGEHGMAGGDTALHEAIYAGSAKMVKLLLAHGADPDCADASGITPIELARRKDRSHLVHLMEAHIDKKLSLAATKSEIEPLYTVPKVAALLSVDDTFVLDLIKTRKITGLHLDDKTLRITAGSLQRYLAKLAK